MSCKFEKERLSAYHDGELDPRERAQVEKHVKECPACARDLQNVQGVSNLIRSAGRALAPEELRRGLRVAPEPQVIRFRGYLQGALACAAAMLLVFVIIALTQSGGPAPVEDGRLAGEGPDAPLPPDDPPEPPEPQPDSKKQDEEPAQAGRSAPTDGVIIVGEEGELSDEVVRELLRRFSREYECRDSVWEATMTEEDLQKMMKILESRGDLTIEKPPEIEGQLAKLSETPRPRPRPQAAAPTPAPGLSREATKEKDGAGYRGGGEGGGGRQKFAKGRDRNNAPGAAAPPMKRSLGAEKSKKTPAPTRTPAAAAPPAERMDDKVEEESKAAGKELRKRAAPRLVRIKFYIFTRKDAPELQRKEK
jgi:hypothetical protein